MAEYCDVGLDDVEELGDDGGYAAEVGGAGFPAEAFGEAVDIDIGGVIVGVDFTRRRLEDDIAAALPEQFVVAVEVPGVAIEVFSGAELSGINEDGDDQGVATVFNRVEEGQVPFMEVSHRGDEADASALAFEVEGGGLHLRDGFNNQHI